MHIDNILIPYPIKLKNCIKYILWYFECNAIVSMGLCNDNNVIGVGIDNDDGYSYSSFLSFIILLCFRRFLFVVTKVEDSCFVVR